VKYREFIAIIEARGFQLDRSKGRHFQYEAVIDGQRRIVTVACSHQGEDIKKHNLAAMIRQSGLPKNLFR
jgi:predicted RNA binding protein YcfA (HicA-like mRNA interferase family)